MRIFTRVLSATTAALLISAGHPALSQKRHGPHPQDKPQSKQEQPAQTKPQTGEPQTTGAKPPETEPQRQLEALKPEMQQDRPPELPRDLQWGALKEEGLGTTMDMPRAVFSAEDGHAFKDVGRRYKTPDGRAKVSIWTEKNAKHENPASYLRRTFEIPSAGVDYQRNAKDFSAVSGVSGNKVFYVRCNLDHRDGSFHCFDLAYPAAEKKAWDGVVMRMSRSLKDEAKPKPAG